MAWKRGDIVDLSITIGTAVTQGQGFGIPLILSESIRSENRVDSFTSSLSMLDAGYQTTDREYLMAKAIFDQTSKDGDTVSVVKVGRKLSDQNAIVTVTFDASATAGTFTLDISKEGAAAVTSGTIDYDDAALDIETVLAAMSNVTSADVTLLGTQAGDKLGFTIEFDGDANTDFQVTAVNVGSLTGVTAGTATQTAYGSAVETWTTAYQAVKASDDDFYVCLPGTETKADILELAALTSAERKQFWAVTRDTDVKSKTAGNVMIEIEALGVDNWFMIYHETTGQYANCALAGSTMPDNLYSITACLYPMAGITADTLTDPEITHLITYNINIPVDDGTDTVIPGAFAASTGGADGGIMTEGQFMDYAAAKDFLTARGEEQMYAFLRGTKKVNFDEDGLLAVKSKLASIMQTYGVGNNIIVDGSIVVTVPDLATYDSTKKAARWLDDVTGDGSAAGAIHKVSITFKLAV